MTSPGSSSIPLFVWSQSWALDNWLALTMVAVSCSHVIAICILKQSQWARLQIALISCLHSPLPSSIYPCHGCFAPCRPPVHPSIHPPPPGSSHFRAFVLMTLHHPHPLLGLVAATCLPAYYPPESHLMTCNPHLIRQQGLLGIPSLSNAVPITIVKQKLLVRTDTQTLSFAHFRP